MKMIMFALIGSSLALSAHAARTSDDPIAPTFVIAHPTMNMTDSGAVLTLSVTEAKASFSLSDHPGAQLNLACSSPNALGTSLLAVTYNGEIKIVGRTKACADTLVKIAANPARFQLTVKLATDQVERAAPGFEYQIQTAAQ